MTPAYALAYTAAIAVLTAALWAALRVVLPGLAVGVDWLWSERGR